MAIELKQNFQQIIESHWPALSRVAASYEANPSIQEELLQEIAIAIWQALENFRGDSSLKTYVLRIAHLRAASHVKKELNKIKTQENHQDISSPITLEHMVEQKQQVNKLLNTIRTLPLVQRQLVTLSLEGVKHEAIGEILGMSKNNVAVSLNRARELLKTKLEQANESRG